MTWDDLKRHELVVYSTAWCPDCHRLKRFLQKQGVAFVEIDIDRDPAAAKRLEEATGRTAIPFVQVGDGAFVRGWHEGAPGRFVDGLFLQEVAAALAG
ncbi:MAG: glutaredoxin family protein [Lentisphaeria bacterium]|nr:glutaredoxin family protein [Lentisphaeria bacterium]